MRIDPTTRLYDVTLPVSPELPVWPGDPPIEITPVSRTVAGVGYNSSRIAFPSHCGTHVDPPWHAAHGGATLSEIPLERWVGPCQVVRIDDAVDRIAPEHLEGAAIAAGTTRLLLRTRNSAHWGKRPFTFAADYVALSLAAAHWLVDRGIQLVGIDALSFEPYDSDDSVHRLVLGSGLIAIEGLDLSAVPAGFYGLVCLPLKIEGGDGAPARVILLDHGGN